MSISPGQIRDQVQRLLASPQLLHSGALAKLLHFVVEASLQGRGDELKESRLGMDVFGRAISNCPPVTTPMSTSPTP